MDFKMVRRNTPQYTPPPSLKIIPGKFLGSPRIYAGVDEWSDLILQSPNI